MSTVLVTGGSGFVGSHCILALSKAGHRVRTTVRHLKREPEVRAMLQAAGADLNGRLAFFSADLEKDAGWAEAAAGCDYVLHVASPFPAGAPRHEDELIVPAREGALRVVLTSSFAAIGYGHAPTSVPFDETVWTDLDGAGVSAYAKSKTLAERAAWDFIAREGGPLELAVVNPVGIFGPVLGADISTSILIVKRLLEGTVPGLPRLSFGVVDVRDVADLHLRAMTDPAASGERFLAVAGDFVSMQDIAVLLKTSLGDAALKVPTRQVPNWLLHVAALRDKAIKMILPELGKRKSASHAKARRVLGWQPRTNDEAILSTAESLIRLGLLKQ